MSNLISIIYVSSAIQLFSEDDLVDLLKTCRENNIRNNITGMLLYKDGNFIQVFEGPEKSASDLYQKIQTDPRHHDIHLLGKHAIPERQFPNWLMGFRNVNSLSEDELKGFTHFMDQDFTPKYFVDNPIRAYIMLMNFKQYM